MNKFSVFLVLFCVAEFGWINASETDLHCNPGEAFKQACNTCVCSQDGKTAACTLIACLDLQTPEPDTSTTTTEATTTEGLLEHESSNHVCTPNDIKLEDCNRCRCAANGIGWFCTRRACPPKEVKKRAVISPIADCKPGNFWNDGCNNCFCTDNAVPVCTMMACLGKWSKVKRSIAAANECEPGATWRQDCNSCFCSETGFAACTLKGCFKNFVNPNLSSARRVTQQELNDPNFTCTPSESFKLECNTCKCSTDGKSLAWCTKKKCVDVQLSGTNV